MRKREVLLHFNVLTLLLLVDPSSFFRWHFFSSKLCFSITLNLDLHFELISLFLLNNAFLCVLVFLTLKYASKLLVNEVQTTFIYYLTHHNRQKICIHFLKLHLWSFNQQYFTGILLVNTTKYRK